MIHFSSHNKGYTLLFAVLTATLVLGVSVFILSVSTKQYQLAVAARESMYALYAADSAMECIARAVRIGDIRPGVDDAVLGEPAYLTCYKNSEDEEIVIEDNVFTSKEAESIEVEMGFKEDSTVYVTDTFIIKLAEDTCATAIVRKGKSSEDKNLRVVDTLGYNYCDENGEHQESTRTVERGLRLTTTY